MSIWPSHQGPVRVLGIDMNGQDSAVVAISSLVLSSAGDTHAEVLRVFDGERAERVVGLATPGEGSHLHPVRALGDLVSEVATSVNAIAFRVATNRPDPRPDARRAASCGPVLGLGMARGIPVIPLASATIEHALAGRQGVSPAEIAAVLDTRTIGLSHGLGPIPEHQRGAVLHAIAAAVVGLEELARWRVPAPSRPLRALQTRQRDHHQHP